MSSNEQLRRIGIQLTTHRVVIVTWIATDMLHQHLHIFAFPAQYFGIHQSEVTAITITTNRTKRTESCKFLCHLHTANVARMPYLVTRFEVVKILLIPVGVRVTDDAYLFHNPKRLRMNSAISFSVSTKPKILESIHRS